MTDQAKSEIITLKNFSRDRSDPGTRIEIADDKGNSLSLAPGENPAFSENGKFKCPVTKASFDTLLVEAVTGGTFAWKRVGDHQEARVPVKAGAFDKFCEKNALKR